MAHRVIETLKKLEAAERRAWNVKMNGSIADMSAAWGKEGKNHLAWCRAADACYTYCEQQDLLGLSWKQILQKLEEEEIDRHHSHNRECRLAAEAYLQEKYGRKALAEAR